MDASFAQLKKYRLWFAGVFVISVITYLVANSLIERPWFRLLNSEITPARLSLPELGAIASLVSSATSFFGVLATTYLAWRKERREEREADFKLREAELKQREAELNLEKERLEFEKLRLATGVKNDDSSLTSKDPNEAA